MKPSYPTLNARHEGWGLPVLEAMATSTAVVTSNVDSIPEVGRDAASLHDPHDIDAHLEALERLLETETERRTLARDAHDRATQFTWMESATETLGVYRDVPNS